MKDDNDDDDDMIQNQAEAQKANPSIVNSTSASSSLCAPLLFPIKGTLDQKKAKAVSTQSKEIIFTFCSSF